ncbi:MAG: DNA-directed RNA polymerase subunit D [Candidatus Altiarchaeota archaeon]
MMKITNVKAKDNRMSFTIGGINSQYANAIRRSIISAVPIIAIEKVDIYNNSSIMNDETLAHRLGLVPLTTDLKTYNLPAECTCEGKGCGKCTVILTLDVKGPKTVYSADLKSEDPKVKPVYDEMQLVKLAPSQEIKLEAHARLGKGFEHIKWQGGLAAYDETAKGTYDFIVESYGQLSLKELVRAAFESFEKNLEELEKAIK